ncbi:MULTISPECIES: nuclear transport factor 2 family protein [Achromobacter]|jgi:predicted SnoaL-like aldol condensation-catalyzing enzyme|uniref:nuclear transport factor 2 family protein n=1 Tax=Achromobacter TaxID=222 RepID=UPI0006C240BA|nr:nuclear transport factor 2 family protein [Achromobacter kerstersii]CUJ66804.1 Predicted ester cyclase [Achromobacter kerstersii]
MTSIHTQADRTRELVTRAHHELFNLHNTGALERLFSPAFIEHSALVKDGIDGLFKLLHDHPAIQYDAHRVLVDGDLVALHGRYTGLDAEPLVGFDIYRVADGLIVEHWDGLVPEAAPNASGRTQLDGPTEPRAGQDTDANRALVTAFFKRALIEGDYTAFSDYGNGEGFHQHSPDIADGTTAVIDFLNQLRKDGQELKYSRTHRSVAEGDFVLTHSEGSIAGTRHAYFELWRVQDGKVAELWDAIMPVPDDRQAAHAHGIF